MFSDIGILFLYRPLSRLTVSYHRVLAHKGLDILPALLQIHVVLLESPTPS